MVKKSGGKKKKRGTESKQLQKKTPNLPPMRTGARKHSPAAPRGRGR